MNEAEMRRIEERFAAAVARVPRGEPLGKGLIDRAKTAGLRRIVARGGPMADEARAELIRRGRPTNDEGETT